MAFSIRTRLTFWYTTLLFVSLLAFGAIFSYSLLKIFIYRMDNQIISIADMMVHTVINPSGKLFIPRDFDIMLERFFGVRTAGSYIQVLDPHGGILAKSSNMEGFNITVPGSHLPRRVRRGHHLRGREEGGRVPDEGRDQADTSRRQARCHSPGRHFP